MGATVRGVWDRMLFESGERSCHLESGSSGGVLRYGFLHLLKIVIDFIYPIVPFS